MNYEDLDLRQPTNDPTIWNPPPPETPHTGLRILAALLLVAVVVTGYFVFRNRNPPSSAGPTASSLSDAQTPAAAPLGANAEAVTLPPLDESDDAVRELVKNLSSHPSVLAWLAGKNLVRTFTVVVSNIASGDSASGQVPVLQPRTGFLVEERGQDAFINPRSYARYTLLATAATSIDPAGAARLYTTLKPRIGDAYRELGFQDTLFDQTLERAIVLLLRTPTPSGRIAVQPAGAVYGFADPKLEALTPSQKLLIRFGPDNQQAVQSSLRAIALALGIPPERLP